jgi:hypothetical protein
MQYSPAQNARKKRRGSQFFLAAQRNAREMKRKKGKEKEKNKAISLSLSLSPPS